MRPTTTTYRCAGIAIATMLALFIWTRAAAGQSLPSDPRVVFLPDDPIPMDPDRIPLDTIPAPRPVSDYVNALRVTFLRPGSDVVAAVNVNTLGDVPASSWFEPRIGKTPMAPEQLATGPNVTGGPADGRWRVVDIKTEGVSPGMTVIDERGERYLLKFDDPEHPAMASSAEVISTKIFYALGYHVPENYVVHFTADQLHADTSEGVTPAEVEQLVSDLYVHNGRFRALASLFLEGEPIGPFLYFDRRPDDANDIFPHEARRELRGMRLAAAWVDHFDARAQNSLDMVVERGDGAGRYVRHHLIDFGSTLGGGALGPKRLWYGHELAVEAVPILLRTLTFGLAGSGWATIDYPDVPNVGRFTVHAFEPEEWVPAFRNPAFDRMDARDAFWMAARIASIGDEGLRRIVDTAEYPDDSTAAFMARALAGRRDRIASTYLGLGGGVDRFRWEPDDGREWIRYTDMARMAGIENLPPTRRYTWYTFDNRSSPVAPISSGARITTGETSTGRIPFPEITDEAASSAHTAPDRAGPAFLAAEIRTEGFGVTRVFIRCREATCEVVGVKRRSEDEGWTPGWG